MNKKELLECLKSLSTTNNKRAGVEIKKEEAQLILKIINNYKKILDKIKEYINTNKKILYQGRNEFTCEIQYSDEVVKAKDILELLEEIE